MKEEKSVDFNCNSVFCVIVLADMWDLRKS